MDFTLHLISLLTLFAAGIVIGLWIARRQDRKDFREEVGLTGFDTFHDKLYSMELYYFSQPDSGRPGVMLEVGATMGHGPDEKAYLQPYGYGGDEDEDDDY